MNDSTSQRSGGSHPRWFKRAAIVLSPLFLLAFAAMVIRAWGKVRSGEGLAKGRTFWLVEDSWLGTLVFFGALVLALAVALLLRWRHQRKEQREWRELEEMKRP